MKKAVLVMTIATIFLVHVSAQEVSVPQIGIQAPSFSGQSTNGKINFPDDYGKSWKILFSHPKDFTPVCSSEMLELAYEQESFEKMNVKLVVLSTDILEQHNSWKAALEEISYEGRTPVKINFPLVADNDMKISNKYGMIHSAESLSQNIRGVFILDPDNKIRALYFYPNEVGRNIEEIKRTVQALQATYANQGLVSPANWIPGKDMMVPVLSAADKKTVNSENSDFYNISWFMTFKKL